MKIIGPKSISRFVPFGNHYWPTGIDAARSGLLPACLASFTWVVSLPSTHLSFISYHFLGLKELAASSALCLSFSSYLQKPVFPQQKEGWCSVYIYIHLALLLYRGSNSAVVFRCRSVNGHSSEDDTASQGTRSQRFYPYSGTSTWLESTL